MITYLCKYTPVELLAALGETLQEPNTDAEDFRQADTIIHSSLCTHAKMLLEAAIGEECGKSLVLTNCCDSVRRVYDTLPPETFSYKKMLDLPHSAREKAISLYADELLSLKDELMHLTGNPFRRDILISSWKTSSDRWAAFRDRSEPYIAILGARVSDQLRTKIRDLMPYPAIDLTCGGLRTMPPPPDRAFIDVPDRPADCGEAGHCPGRTGLSDEELIREYARALLTQIPCTRMDDVSARAIYTEDSALAGIVYHSVRFCDYYSGEYAEIRRSTDLPVLKIESDYTSQSEGQLDTRLRAFAESLELPEGRTDSGNSRTDTISSAKNTSEEAGHKPMKNIYIGIDSGSTSTNVAALDDDGRLAAWCIVRTGARAGTAAEKALADVKRSLGKDAECIRRIVATGYGREFISFADSTKTEISCHARGAHYADPKARTVIDIGGQDSKVICLDEDGNVMNFVMNDKCAAGTGRFLEMMAQTLEMDMDTIGSRGLKWKKDLTISSTCTVFAESEVVGLIAENTAADDIIHALNKSVASRAIGLVRRVQGKGPYMMTGGVAKNTGVAKEIERRLGEKLAVMEHPDLIGAIGAALFARN